MVEQDGLYIFSEGTLITSGGAVSSLRLMGTMIASRLGTVANIYSNIRAEVHFYVYEVLV